MVEFARNEAIAIIESDPTLAQFPVLKSVVEKKDFEIHFE
jgi:hypothetical protein